VELYAFHSLDQYDHCFSSSDNSLGRGTSPGTTNKQAAKSSGNANKGYQRLSLFCRSLKEVRVARRYACRIRRRNKIGQRANPPKVSLSVVCSLSPSPGDTRNTFSYVS